MTESDSGIIAIPIEWHSSESLVSRYATNLTIQHTQHEFIISFFEILPPLILGSSEEVGAQLAQVKSVRAECVARVVIAAERMPEFLKAFQVNLEQYNQNFGKAGESSEHSES